MAWRYCGVARSWGEPHICRDDGREPHHGGRPHRSHQALACRLQLGPLGLCSMVEDTGELGSGGPGCNRSSGFRSVTSRRTVSISSELNRFSAILMFVWASATILGL